MGDDWAKSIELPAQCCNFGNLGHVGNEYYRTYRLRSASNRVRRMLAMIDVASGK
jgi:hypothetical protein